MWQILLTLLADSQASVIQGQDQDSKALWENLWPGKEDPGCYQATWTNYGIVGKSLHVSELQFLCLHSDGIKVSDPWDSVQLGFLYQTQSSRQGKGARALQNLRY